MNILDRRTASVLTTILLFAVVAVFLYGARKILIVFLFAIFFAYLLYPLILIVQRKSRLTPNSRDGAILQVYVVLLVCFGGIVFGVGPYLVDEARRLGAALPSLIDRLTSGQIAWTIGGKHGWSHETQFRIQQFLAGHRDAMVSIAQDIGRKAALVLSDAIWVVLIPILAIFFLRDGQHMAQQAVRIVGVRRDRVLVRGIIDDISEMLAGYIRAQLLLAGMSLIVYTVVLLMMRVPYAAVLGFLAGVAEFVPVAGPLAAALSILGVAFLTNYPHLWLLLAFLGVWRLAQDYYNSPRIMGGKLKLHPLAALFAILVGGELGGMLGVFLSIPIVATLRILWRRWQTYLQPQDAGSRPHTDHDVRAA